MGTTPRFLPLRPKTLLRSGTFDWAFKVRRRSRSSPVSRTGTVSSLATAASFATDRRSFPRKSRRQAKAEAPADVWVFHPQSIFHHRLLPDHRHRRFRCASKDARRSVPADQHSSCRRGHLLRRYAAPADRNQYYEPFRTLFHAGQWGGSHRVAFPTRGELGQSVFSTWN